VHLAVAIQAGQQDLIQVAAIEQVGVGIQRVGHHLMYCCQHLVARLGAEVQALTVCVGGGGDQREGRGVSKGREGGREEDNVNTAVRGVHGCGGWRWGRGEEAGG
jgi:hypothetical protein